MQIIRVISGWNHTHEAKVLLPAHSAIAIDMLAPSMVERLVTVPPSLTLNCRHGCGWLSVEERMQRCKTDRQTSKEWAKTDAYLCWREYKSSFLMQVGNVLCSRKSSEKTPLRRPRPQTCARQPHVQNVHIVDTTDSDMTHMTVRAGSHAHHAMEWKNSELKGGSPARAGVGAAVEMPSAFSGESLSTA